MVTQKRIEFSKMSKNQILHQVGQNSIKQLDEKIIIIKVYRQLNKGSTNFGQKLNRANPGKHFTSITLEASLKLQKYRKKPCLGWFNLAQIQLLVFIYR